MSLKYINELKMSQDNAYGQYKDKIFPAEISFHKSRQTIATARTKKKTYNNICVL